MKEDPQKKKPSGERDIQSVKRALDILQTVAVSGETGVTEIAKAVGLHVATTHNLLRTLARYDYLENSGGRYRIGPAVSLLVGGDQNLQGLPQLLAPWMQRISRESGEAASSSALSNGVLRILAFEPGTKDVTVNCPQWIWPQPLRLATGRVLVSQLPRSGWDEYIAYAQDVEDGWTEEDWIAELQQVGSDAFSVLVHSQKEDQNGQFAVGFPVISRSGVAALALGASAPVFRISPELSSLMFRAARDTAHDLSAQFGADSKQLEKIKNAPEPDWKKLLKPYL